MTCSLISYTFQQFEHIWASLLLLKRFFPLASTMLFLWMGVLSPSLVCPLAQQSCPNDWNLLSAAHTDGEEGKLSSGGSETGKLD